MVVGAISDRGVLPLIKVPQNTKINSKYYIDHVLKPIIEQHLVSLYGQDISKVFIHLNAAPSHTSKKT